MKTIYPHTTLKFKGWRFHYSGPGEVMSHRSLIALLDKLSRGVFESCNWQRVEGPKPVKYGG